MGVEGADVQVDPATGHVIYRASALGGCTKRLILTRMGYDLIDPRGSDSERVQKVMARMDDGHEHEDTVVRKLAERGVIVYNRDGECVLPVSGKIMVMGHYDGVNDGRVVEIKSMGDKEWNEVWNNGNPRWHVGLWPRYQWQISVYMEALQLPCEIFFYNRDTEELQSFIKQVPFYDTTEIRTRVLSVERAARNYDPPGPCDMPSFPCPLFYMHESDRLEFEDGDDAVVQGLAEAYDRAKKERDDAEERYRKATKALLKAVGETGKFETLQGWKVTAYDPGKGTLDRDKVLAFIEEHGGDVDEFKQLQIRVTPPKEKE